MKKMLTLSLSPPQQSLCLSTPRHVPVIPSRNAPFQASTRLSTLAPSSGWIGFNPLRYKEIKKKSRGSGAVCSAAPFSPRNLQWISAISSAILLITKGTMIRKQFIVPLFAIQAPASIIAWMKGEYGLWAAFLTLLVRLFFFIPGELELPFLALLLVIVTPYNVLNISGTQQGAIIALVIAAYLAYQHFSGAGSFQRAFDQGSIIATIAVVCITVISCLLLIRI
ncbi:cold-regulated 413 inner membrane protein 1, chloroplastic-like isoform X2 [Hibiscus syriacus]|uniref:cold-regulated 413 inner membrane protein 1, chloroplastic-like isoform X2 n=1 Tax=Hibiscus syriacus TaxID=106335 RepID=UPI001920421B|nr:cold-regulated 413 inner membrane protein 1, chloroplastic-like isoform X2 [Hibiscus syriacus]